MPRNHNRSLGLLLIAGLAWPVTTLPATGCAGPQASARGERQDRDRDGVPDDIDRCPDKAGPIANLGCPERDEDNDGVVDRLDACPTTPGPASNTGCPDGSTALASQQGPTGGAPGAGQGMGLAGTPGGAGTAGGMAGAPGQELAQLRGDRFAWPEPITFDPGTDVLTERGKAEVAATARAIQAHPELLRLRIEGHVDEPNNTAARARDLSKRRAEAVKRALMEAGVPAEKLRTVGYGYSRLIDHSETPEARKVNNRIEIVVVQ